MKNLQKILIPIDFSPVALNAIRYANGILEKHLTEVTLVYVNTYEKPLKPSEIQSAFKAFEREALQHVTFYYKFKVLNGNLLTELVNESKAREIDLVIMGTKGERASDLSLASALIRSVFCPVIVVPENFHKLHIRKIAFANDYRPIQSSEAIKPLWEFALEFRAKVYLLHINYSRKEELVPADDAESTLEYYLQSLEHEYDYLESDDVELTIHQYIEENKIDLLVILSRDHGSNQLKSEGRLIAQLTAHAAVPILALC